MSKHKSYYGLYLIMNSFAEQFCDDEDKSRP
jgi:hypothetical protein